MKFSAFFLILIVTAGAAQAVTIYEMRTDQVPEFTSVVVTDLVVTGSYGNGAFVSQAPFGEYHSIWIFVGNDAAEYPAPGEVITVEGVFKLFFGLYEIDVTAGEWETTGLTDLPEPLVVPAALLTDPVTAAPYMCSLIHVPDYLYFTSLADYGEWFATALDGSEILFDNWWYPAPSEEDIGTCFASATGCLNYTWNHFKVSAFVDGLPACPVSNEGLSFGSLKSLYR